MRQVPTQPDRLSPEFRLVAACCCWPPSATRAASVSDLALAVDWARVEQIARRHRVEALVWRGLDNAGVQPPQPVAATLSTAASAIARENLLLAAESLRLDRLFGDAGIAVLFVKGLTLGQLAYGDIALKRGWDIDILILPEALPGAAALLEQAGYRCITPSEPVSAERLARWHRRSKESVWRHSQTQVHVELHTALVDNAWLLPGLDAAGPSRPVEILPGRSLRTLPHDALFAYLCVHGASSAWFRLKWLADLAALIAPESSEEIERLYRSSQALGAGRAAAQALLLAHRLFETPVPAELLREFETEGLNRWLADAALGLMAGRYETVELHDRRFATLPIHLTQLALLPGRRFAVSEAVRQIGGVVRRS